MPRFYQNGCRVDAAPPQFMAQAFTFRAQCFDFSAVIQLSMKIESPVCVFASFHSALSGGPFSLPP